MFEEKSNRISNRKTFLCSTIPKILLYFKAISIGSEHVAAQDGNEFGKLIDSFLG